MPIRADKDRLPTMREGRQAWADLAEIQVILNRFPYGPASVENRNMTKLPAVEVVEALCNYIADNVVPRYQAAAEELADLKRDLAAVRRILRADGGDSA